MWSRLTPGEHSDKQERCTSRTASYSSAWAGLNLRRKEKKCIKDEQINILHTELRNVLLFWAQYLYCAFFLERDSKTVGKPRSTDYWIAVSNSLSIHRPCSSDVTDITKVFTTTVEQHHFAVLSDERMENLISTKSHHFIKMSPYPFTKAIIDHLYLPW